MSIINTYSSIIVAVIGFGGALIPILYSSNLSINNSALVDISTDNQVADNEVENITIKNIGNTIVTNISIYINTSSIISNLTNLVLQKLNITIKPLV